MESRYKIPVLIPLLLVAAFTGYKMWTLPLWGYLPLYFFLSVWLLLVLLPGRDWSGKNKATIKLLGLSSLSGVLLSAGFPPLPFTPLMFVAFVPMLLVENEIFNSHKGQGKWKLFKIIYPGIVLWNILTTYWVANTAFVAGIFAIVVNSLLMCIPWLLFHQTRRTLPARFAYPSLAAYWISFEYLHMQWELSWPWLTLGNAFARFPSWIQWYEYTGTFGGSLWIWVTNFMFFGILINFLKSGTWSRKRIISVSAVILLPVIFSLMVYQSYKENGEHTNVLVIQPNFEPHYEKFAIPQEMQLQRIGNLIKSNLDETVKYIILPETSFRGDHNRLDNNLFVDSFRGILKEYPNTRIVTGVNGYAFIKEGDNPNKSLRTYIKGSDTLYWESYNSSIQLSGEIESIPIYLKSKLVPGAESFPYSGFFFFMEGLVDQLGGSIAGLGTQKQRSVFSGPAGKVGTAICYESVYGEYCTGYVRKGANALFIITNDGWWDNTAGHKQHLMFAALRAIETRRSIARSANTGISAIITQRGDILSATEYEKTDAVKGSIHMSDAKTFYVKWGDLISRIALFCAAIFLLNTVVRSVTGEKKKKLA